MLLTGKEDSKKENIDSILNMSFKLHSSIDQSIGEFQETRKGRGVIYIFWLQERNSHFSYSTLLMSLYARFLTHYILANHQGSRKRYRFHLRHDVEISSMSPDHFLIRKGVF